MSAHPDRDPAVDRYLATVEPAKRRRDGATLADLIEAVSSQPARLIGTIIGCGRYDYRYASGRTGSASAIAFAPRKPAAVVYLLDGIRAHGRLIEQLGPHTSGVGCLYLKDLEDVDMTVLREILERSYAALTAGTFTDRARDGKEASDA